MNVEKVGNVLCDYLKSDKLGKGLKKGAAKGIGLTHFTPCYANTWKKMGGGDMHCCM